MNKNDIITRINVFYEEFISKFQIPLNNKIFYEGFEEVFGKCLDNIKDDINSSQLQDAFFAEFTRWMKSFSDENYKAYDLCVLLWKKVYLLAINWENQNPGYILNKGTLYYFYGASYILINDFESAHILINQALIEDIRLNNGVTPDTPAFKYIYLSPEQDHALNHIVNSKIEFLTFRIEEYNNICNINLTFLEFQEKFLKNPNFVDESLLFSFVLSKYLHSSKYIFNSFINNFTSINCISILFDITIIIEKLLYNILKIDKLKALIQSFSKKCTLNITVDIDKLNTQINQDFNNTLNTILSNSYLINIKNKQIGLSEIEKGLYLVYAIRNYRAHNISANSIILQNHNEIFEYILQTLFFVVDKLYKSQNK